MDTRIVCDLCKSANLQFEDLPDEEEVITMTMNEWVSRALNPTTITYTLKRKRHRIVCLECGNNITYSIPG